MDFTFLWGAFIGLFAIINPFSAALVFLGISSKGTDQKRKDIAKRASIVSAMILIFFMLTGTVLFKFFGITIEAFKIAGGLLVAIVGFHMIYPRPKLSAVEEMESRKKEDISIVPLAIPMLSGPGAITTALVWASKANGIDNKMGLILIPVIIAIISFIILYNAKVFKEILGHTGINVIGRLMGLIVLVMGVQFIINALRVLLPSILS